MSDHAFLLIETPESLATFYHNNKSVPWLCFDTEFVGEKRFLTRLCLIQIATPNGNYLIDPFKVSNLDAFLELLVDPAIVKITHAGDNDYRLLHTHYSISPKNVFDTQVAAAFVGYKYPVSFKKLVENELRILLKKGYAVTDWEGRPFNRQQLAYALDDVLPLYDLWKALEAKLRKRNRLAWALEECARWESEAFFMRDPHQEALTSGMMKSLSTREQIFLIRLFAWRRELAEKKNYSKEMVLPSKLFGHIVKSIASGKEALRQHRRVPDKIVDQYGSVFEQMYRHPPTDEERFLLTQLPTEEPENPHEEVLLEMLNLLVKHKCLEAGVPSAMVLPRNALNRLKSDGEAIDQYFGNGWRKQLLGAEFIDWLRHFDQLKLDVEGGRIEIIVGKNGGLERL